MENITGPSLCAFCLQMIHESNVESLRSAFVSASWYDLNVIVGLRAFSASLLVLPT